MGQGSDLHQLIQSLSPSEKRYFKIFAGQNSLKGQNNYIRLFDILDRLEQYEDEKVRAAFGEAKMARQLPVVRTNLYKLILKALRNYGSEQSIEFKLRELLLNVEILFRKNLVQQCIKLLDKGTQIATQYERHEILIEILNYRMALAMKATGGNLDKLRNYIADILKTADDTFSRFKNILEYRNLSYQVLLMNRQEEFTRSINSLNQYRRIMANPLLQDVDRSLSAKARLYYFQTHFVYHYAQSNFSASLIYAQKVVETLEENHRLIEEHPDNYLHALHNVAAISLRQKLPEAVIETLQKIKSIDTQLPSTNFPKSLRHRAEVLALTTEMELLLVMGKFEEGLGLADQFRKEEAKFLKDFNINEGFVLMNTWFVMAQLYLGIGDLSQSLQYVNRILNAPGVGSQYETFMNARILQLLVFFEQEERELLEYNAISLYRFLYSRQRLHKFESAIMEMIRRAGKVAGKEEMRELFQELLRKLTKIGKDPFEQKAFEHFNLSAWLESKIRERPLGKIYEEIFNQG